MYLHQYRRPRGCVSAYAECVIFRIIIHMQKKRPVDAVFGVRALRHLRRSQCGCRRAHGRRFRAMPMQMEDCHRVLYFQTLWGALAHRSVAGTDEGRRRNHQASTHTHGIPLFARIEHGRLCWNVPARDCWHCRVPIPCLLAEVRVWLPRVVTDLEGKIIPVPGSMSDGRWKPTLTPTLLLIQTDTPSP